MHTALNALEDRDGVRMQPSTGISVIPRHFCPLCSCKGKLQYIVLVDWLFGVPETWGTRCCSTCGVAWLDPQPVANDVPRLYSHYCTHITHRSLAWLGQLQHAISQ